MISAHCMNISSIFEAGLTSVQNFIILPFRSIKYLGVFLLKRKIKNYMYSQKYSFYEYLTMLLEYIPVNNKWRGDLVL